MFSEKATNVFIETTHLTFCLNLNWLDPNHVLIKLWKNIAHCNHYLENYSWRNRRLLKSVCLVLWSGLRFFKIKYLVKVRQVWIFKRNLSVFHYFSRKTCFVTLLALAQIYCFEGMLNSQLFYPKGLWKFIFQKGQ